MASYTPNLNLYKPDDSDDYEDFREEFNENMDKLDQGGNANQNIAEAYDDTATYAVGDYVIYNGLLYKCDTAVTMAETFDPTKWTHVVVTDEMGSGGGGSGDTVTWNQIQQSGTKIAEISINGTSQDVYAPQGGGSGSLDAVETTSNAYALLPQADKEDPTKIYFLNDTQSSVVDTPIDQSTFVLKVENQSQMSVAVTNGKLVSVYNYGSSIGACAFEPNAISATASKIKYKFATIGSYDTAQSHAITIGVKANYQSSNWIFSTDADWLVKKVYDTRNTSVDDYIDISWITTPCYLMICFHGWTVTFDEFLVEDVSVPTGDTEIRYKDVPYGNNGGESGGNYYLNTIYSTEEKKVGYWTDGKPLYQKSFTINTSNLNTGWNDISSGLSGIDCKDITGKFRFPANDNSIYEFPYTENSNYCLFGGYKPTNDTIFVYKGTGFATISDFVVTLRYTKNTDTPEPNPQTGGVIYLPSIYSGEEREIGVWHDGKPLYQITIDQTIGSDADYTVFASGIENAHLVNAKCEYSSGRWMSANYPSIGNVTASKFCYVEAWNGALKLHNQTNQSMRWVATIQYTKTTDVAGSGTWTPSGELAHHYSTNEQVVGTWLGKPLYEKCFTYSSVSFSNQQMVLANDLSNVDYVVSYGGCAKEPRDNRNIPLPYMRKAWGESIFLHVMQLPDRTLSTAIVTSDSWYTSLENIMVWVRYTKTTD